MRCPHSIFQIAVLPTAIAVETILVLSLLITYGSVGYTFVTTKQPVSIAWLQCGVSRILLKNMKEYELKFLCTKLLVAIFRSAKLYWYQDTMYHIGYVNECLLLTVIFFYYKPHSNFIATYCNYAHSPGPLWDRSRQTAVCQSRYMYAQNIITWHFITYL